MRIKLYRKRYYVVWVDPISKETRRSALHTADREEADRCLIDFKRKLAAESKLVRDFVRAYLDYKRDRIADPVRLEGAWKNAEPTFGHLRPDQISPELCERYARARRASGRSNGTIIKEINVIRQALNWGKAVGARFEAPRQPPPRDRHLTKAEAAKLLAACIQHGSPDRLKTQRAMALLRDLIAELTLDTAENVQNAYEAAAYSLAHANQK